MNNLFYVRSFSRSGSNLLTSFLHNNNDNYCLARRDFKSIFENTSSVSLNILKEYISVTKKDIYFNGGFRKNLNLVKNIIIEKPELNFNNLTPNNTKSIILFRNPLSIMNSHHTYGLKYSFKDWIFEKNKIKNFLKTDLRNFFSYLKNNANSYYYIKFEDLIDKKDTYVRMNEYLGVDRIIFNDESFKHNFCKNCIIGGFSLKEIETGIQSFNLLQHNDKYNKSLHYYCKNCDTFTLGYGGFNPAERIKVEKSKFDLKGIHKDILPYSTRILNDFYGKDFTDKILNNSFALNDLMEI